MEVYVTVAIPNGLSPYVYGVFKCEDTLLNSIDSRPKDQEYITTTETVMTLEMKGIVWN